MGTITAGVGLISGIDTASLIEQLLAIEGRGKLALNRRVQTLQTQQTAMLDINARLLNLKNAVRKFRVDRIFQSASATSSNESVLTATASAGAVPGSYSFIVDRLVQTSQQMTRGFNDLNETGIGLTKLTFEFGRGQVERNQDLEYLNGGEGVRRGRIQIQDAAGNTAAIDLSRIADIGEVIEAINAAAGISVTASIEGDSLKLTDTSGGEGAMVITNLGGSFTATDLGILGSDGGSGVITGAAINTIGAETDLSRLNDRNGVLFSSGLNNTDFIITDRSGAQHNITIGKYDNNGTIVDRVKTLGDVIDRINAQTGGAVTASVAADGASLQLTDNSGGGGLFSVSGGGTLGERTARDLGILNAGVESDTIAGNRLIASLNSVMLRSLNGGNGLLAHSTGDGTAPLAGKTRLNDLFLGAGLGTNGTNAADIRIQDRAGNAYEFDLDAFETVQDLIDAVADATGGTITLEVVDGNRLRATNTVAGDENFQIQDINGSSAADDLGMVADLPPGGGDIIDSVDTTPAGPGGTTLNITTRDGNLTSIDLSSAFSLVDVIKLINDSGAGVTASSNDAGNGLLIADNTGGGGNLIITGGAASDLALGTGAQGVASDRMRGGNLQLQYVSGATRLSDLNYGRGIGTGTFRMVDAEGQVAEVEIGSDSRNLRDIIDKINSRGIEVQARINDTGDGIILESTSAIGTSAIRVENISGSAARDLGILGTAKDGVNANFIDGSYERTITFDATDTLDTIASKINSAGIPVIASIINTGSATRPHHLTLTSTIVGARGDMSIDAHGFDLGLQTLATGEDGRVFYGSTDPAKAVLIRGTSNTLERVINNVRIDLMAASESPVTVSVTRDTQAIVDAVKNFVTTFNDVIGRINDYDKFDQETETKGVLLGNSTVARVRSSLYRTLQSAATGVDSEFRFLSQVGIRVGAKGELTINEDRFRAALESDPDAVANLFAAFEQDSQQQEEIAPGVTVDRTSTTHSRLGLMEQFLLLADALTNTVDGTLKTAGDGFDTQIKLVKDRIAQFDLRLEAKRLHLERQFAAMESALSRLQNQQGALASMQAALLNATAAGLSNLRGR